MMLKEIHKFKKKHSDEGLTNEGYQHFRIDSIECEKEYEFKHQ